MGGPRRAAIYARISEDPTGLAEGVARHKQDCQRFCAERGWDVVGYYEDNDISASRYTRRKRPSYQQLLGEVRGGAVDAIVAWHIDRLYRQPRELEDLIDLAEHGLVVSTLYGDFDLATSDGRAFARVMVAMAAKASDDTSRRVARQKLQRAEEGKAIRSRSFGYQTDGTTIVEDEAELLRRAAAEVLAGESITSVARQWNELGVGTPRKGVPWSATIVRSVLTNPKQAGLRVHKGKTYDGQWVPIIDRITHERLVALLADPARRRRQPARRSLLTGICRCGRPGCGAVLTRDLSRDGPVWRCRTGVPQKGCGRLVISAPALEAWVERLLLRQHAEHGAAHLQPPEEKGPDLHAELVAVSTRLGALAADWAASGDMEVESWQGARRPLEQRKRELILLLAQRDATSLLALPGITADLDAAWPALSVDRKRAWIQFYVDRVVVHPGRPGRVQDMNERVQIIWR